ncbi:hypothetical protein MMYC01_202655 [Madurella mycetomatis]|uniref:Uncharacterized protein n=1 Tax=Madurella mycetomatis TaxID=100816 RepID=A0A175WEU5_9PEZI|nr:hypothetical protein MMYC01_202655 [Madurella mycetomatis]
MKLFEFIAALSVTQIVCGAPLEEEWGVPTYAKLEVIEPKFFKDLGSKRARISYGPYLVPSSEDPETHGMLSFRDMNILLPCHDCLITSFTADLQYEGGKTANANTGMWLHHNGLMNLNRTDMACEHWPERMAVNGNERSVFDYTLKGTRKAGYYLREGDQVFLVTEAMNMREEARTVYMVMEWEYLPGTPAEFDIVFPIWLDVKGNCLNETNGVQKEAGVFTAKAATGWTSKYSGDLILAVPHTHDGNTLQEVYMDGKLVCSSVPAYGETAEFVSHVESDGHGHDHGESEHIYHISSITQCANVSKVVPGSHFTISSFYDYEKHVPMKDHHGELEPIMGIQFLYLARPQAEAIEHILSMKPGDLQAFTSQVGGNGGD